MRVPPRSKLDSLFPRSLRGASDHQRRLAAEVSSDDALSEPRVVAGADVSYDQASGRLFAAAVAFDASSREKIAVGRFSGPVRVPYVPGFLSYREGPAVLEALRNLGAEPDLLFCDGHGTAHPRRFGLACHVAVALRIPVIGVAKSLLVGCHDEPGRKPGSSAPILHRGERVGVALRTRRGVKPVYVSVGSGLRLDTAIRLVRSWSGRVKLPEPVHAADRLVAEMRRSALEEARGAGSGAE